MHVRQPAIDAVVSHRQLQVIDAEQMQNRGVDVVDLGGAEAVGGLVAERVRVWKGQFRGQSAASDPYHNRDSTPSL